MGAQGNSAWTRGAAVLAVAALPITAWASTSSEFSRDLEVDTAAYMGTWYELGRTQSAFEDNDATIAGVRYGACAHGTATYTLVSATRVAVENRCQRSAVDGSGQRVEDALSGVGLVVPGSAGRKLKLAFGNALFRIITRVLTLGGADYWVFGVGPRGEDGRYDWALVGGPARDGMFVLTRTPDVSDDVLAEILRLGEAEGLPVDELIFDSQR